MKILFPLLVTSALFLTACEREAAQPVGSDTEAVTAVDFDEGHQQDVTLTENLPAILYDCDNGERIQARYDNRTENTSVTLAIDGKSYWLYSVPTASGARYASEQGLQPEEGMQWLTKGNEALLTNLILDHTVPAEEATILARCEIQNGQSTSEE